MTIRVIITTCDRPAMLRALVGSLRSKARSAGIRLYLCLYDDATARPARLRGLHLYRRYEPRRGRLGYWRTVADALRDAHHAPFDYLMMLPDDVTLRRGFFQKAIATWEGIHDPAKICLNLMRDDRAFSASWTRYRPHLRQFGDLSVIQSQWNDLCFLGTGALVDALDGRIDPIEESGLVSSGVGRQLSIRLNDQGFSLYCVYETLVDHGAHASRMHPALTRPTT